MTRPPAPPPLPRYGTARVPHTYNSQVYGAARGIRLPVIDNETIPLLGELQKFLPHAERASIAVGYFFISGFAEIMDSLGRIEASDNPNHMLRLLISPTTDRRTAEAILNANESYQDAKRESEMDVSKDDAIEAARDEVTKTLEYMTQTDKEHAAVQKLIRLIRGKKMEVKVYTQSQLHAKAYIFELDEGQLTRGVAIVGSSNLSIAGIREHAELNLQTEHTADHAELLKWFERHWNDRSCHEFTEETAKILEKSWAGRNHTPDDVYGKASLHEHGEIELPDTEGPAGPKAEIELFDFQKKAVSEGIKMLDEYGGVIIADVVGMGKTYVGCSIMKYLREHQHAKPLVICPPHLKEMWEDYMRRFEIYGEVESRYKIGMDDDVLRRHTHCDVILVDESHHFRHHYTNAYRALSAFMDDKTDQAKVILLTATPISNTIKDLKNQIKLFPAEGLERIPVAGAADLDEYFKGVENPDRTVSEEGTAKIQELLRHVLIRRVRGQIIERYAKADGGRHYLEHLDGPKYFPKRMLQNPSEYDVDKVYNNAFESIEEAIGELRMARYVPGKYIREEFMDKEKYQDLASISAPLASIAKSTLLKRMESSIKAFETSVKNYQRGYRLFRAELDKDVIPIGREFKDIIYKMTGGDYDEAEYERDIAGIVSQYDIAAFKVDEWKDDIDWDLKKLAEIMGHLQGDEYTKRDDKLHKLRDLIQKYDEKVLVFSESAETARYIYEYLKNELPERKMGQIDSKKGQKEKMAAVRRFDHIHNPGIDVPADRRLSVLISTDVLSEGVNLHAARVVINYDFHWNPVRLIQRVGRIDRIGSDHAEIEIFNFLPTAKIEAKLELRDRVANKIQTIRKIIGADQRILEATEDIDEQGVTDIYDPQGDDSVLDPKLRGGVLDIPETEAEMHAARIRLDDDRKKYFEDLPFGIRCTTGAGRLLIACEAEDMIRPRRENKSSSEEVISLLRRHYEVTKDGIKAISASSFLEQVGNDTDRSASEHNSSLYNEFVAIVWKKFNRDIKNEQAKSPRRKHQEYFERKLTYIASHDSKLEDRAKQLQPFIAMRMRPTHQPYRSLVDLHKMIDRGDVRDAGGIVSKLEKIKLRYDNIRYERIIRKPRILYSRMVGA